MDPKTSFRVVVMQTELERWKFLVRSFLRARIAKVSEGFSFFSLRLGCLGGAWLCELDCFVDVIIGGVVRSVWSEFAIGGHGNLKR